MDSREEQASEIEALMCIYPNEITMISEDPYEFIITLGTMPETNEEDEDDEPVALTLSDDVNPYAVQLRFKLPAEYPEVVPIVELDEKETNLDEEQLEELRAHLVQQAEENLGMVMVFTLVSATIEWTSTLWDKGRKELHDREIEEERKRQDEEEAERNRFEGTRVTVVTFMQWKTKFDAELAQKRKESPLTDSSSYSDEGKTGAGKKLTGKELFLRDKTLFESDILQEDEKEFGDEDFIADNDGGDGEQSSTTVAAAAKRLNVPIDESLFEDLDDLELEDDDDDDDDE